MGSHIHFQMLRDLFYRAFNSIFGKMGSVTFENTVIELLKAKCLPSLYYGLEACLKLDRWSLWSTVHLRKHFQLNGIMLPMGVRNFLMLGLVRFV